MKDPVAIWQTAAVVLRELLARLLVDMDRHGAAFLAQGEVEALHDYRVALRKTRTLLKHFAASLPPLPLTSGSSWQQLAETSGRARDADVALETLTDLVGPASAPAPAWFGPRMETLRQRQHETRRELHQLLRGPGYLALHESWSGWLQRPVPSTLRAGGLLPADVVATVAVDRALRRLRRAARACADASDAASGSRARHVLRIRCKQARYLIDLCAPVLPDIGVAGLRRTLRQLQNQLGRERDLTLLDACLRNALVEGADSAVPELFRQRLAQEQRETAAVGVAAARAWVAGKNFRQVLRILAGQQETVHKRKESTMKQLTVLRHAKSSHKHTDLTDGDRPLSKGGVEEGSLIGRRLRQRECCPDLLLCSPARRTRETLELVLAELAAEGVAQELDPRIYEASTETLLEVLRGVSDECQHLLLVGHNPGLTELWNLLTGETQEKLPTCAGGTLGLEIASWQELGAGAGTVLFRFSPKDAEPKPAAALKRTKGKCRKGKSEAEAVPGHYRCKRCAAVSDKEKRLCRPEKIR